jgi:hypothetical protein
MNAKKIILLYFLKLINNYYILKLIIMSDFPDSHIFCDNNIYKIVLSMEDALEVNTENFDESEKTQK